MIFQFRLIWRARHIIRYLVTSELRTAYRNKVLGYVWTLLDPLVMMGVYLLLVVVLFARGGPQYPALLFAALLAWWWFAQTIGTAVVSISKRGGLIHAVKFPLVVLPLSTVGVDFIKFLFSLVMLIPFLLAYHATWTVNMLYFPLLVLVQLILTIGIAVLVAVIGVWVQDLENIVRFGIRVVFFLSPALYSAVDRVPERFMGIYMLNPFAALFESYKNVLVLGQSPVAYMGVAATVGIACLLLGLWVFSRLEDKVAVAVT